MQPVFYDDRSDISQILDLCPIASTEGRAQLLSYSLKSGIFRGSILAICRLLKTQPLITDSSRILELLIQEQNWCSPHIFHIALLTLIKNTPALVTQPSLEAIIPLKEDINDFAMLFEELSKFKLKAARFYLDELFYNELLAKPRNFRVLRETIRKIRLLNKHLISIDLLTVLLELSDQELSNFYHAMAILKTSQNPLKNFFDEKVMLLFLSEPEIGGYVALIARGLSVTPELLHFENINMLFQNSLGYTSARWIELAWVELVSLNKNLANQQSFEMIVKNHKEAKEILELLSSLSFHNDKYLSLDLWDFFSQSQTNINDALALTTFLVNYQLKLPLELLESLILTPYLRALNFEIESLIEQNLARFLTVKDLEMLIQIDAQPSHYFFIIKYFYQTDPTLLSDELREFISENIETCPDLAIIINILSSQNLALLNIEGLTRFIKNQDKLLIFKSFFIFQNPRQKYHLTADILNEWWSSPEPFEFLQRLKVVTQVPRLTLNTAQNTHTASIHKSASESAARLLSRYQSKVATDEAIESCYKKIEKWGSRLDKSSKKTVIECSTYTKTNPMVDSESGVGLKQVIALGWIASSDSKARLTDLQTARKRYFEGLYDMWHGYGPSKKICDRGMFNKEIESLVGVHPDAQQRMITREQASAKLGIVVQEELRNFLKSHERKIALQLIAQLEENGSICAVWDNIKPNVTERLFDEFSELYPQGKESIEFTNLIDCALDSNINLGSLKNELLSSAVIFSTGLPPSNAITNHMPPHSSSLKI